MPPEPGSGARTLPSARLPRLRELLYPTDPTYCAEPLDIEDARWLLREAECGRRIPADPLGMDRALMSSGVVIGVSAAETARFTEFWGSLCGMGSPCPVEVRVARGANIARNRNELTGYFLQSSKEWLWYLDDDQVLLPGTLGKLLAHGVEVVSGVYVSRNYPFLPLVYDQVREDGQIAFKELTTETGLIGVVATGAGCLLVHRRVLEALTPPYWTLGQIAPEAWGDDVDFCRRVRAAGFEVQVDVDTRVGHISQCTLWPERSATGWGTTLVTGNRPVCHIHPPSRLVTP